MAAPIGLKKVSTVRRHPVRIRKVGVPGLGRTLTDRIISRGYGIVTWRECLLPVKAKQVRYQGGPES